MKEDERNSLLVKNDDDENIRDRMKPALEDFNKEHSDGSSYGFESIPELVNKAFAENSEINDSRNLVSNLIEEMLRRYKYLQLCDETYRRREIVRYLDQNSKKHSLRWIHHRVDALIQQHQESTIYVLDALISGCGDDDENNTEKLIHEALSRRHMDLDASTIYNGEAKFVKPRRRRVSFGKTSHTCSTWKAELQKDMKDIPNPFILQMKIFSQSNAMGSAPDAHQKVND